MNKLWILIGFLALIGIGHADKKFWHAYEDYSDENGKDYSFDNADVVERNIPSNKTSNDDLEFKVNYDDSGEIMYYDDDDKKLEDDGIVQNQAEEVNKNNEKGDNIDDYQIEDNRSEVKEEKNDFGELVENIDDVAVETKDDEDEDVYEDEEAIELKDDQTLDDLNDVDAENYEQELLQQEASEDVAKHIADDDGDDDDDDDDNDDEKDDEDSWESPVSFEEMRNLSSTENNNDIAEDRSFNLNLSQESNLKDVFDDIDRFFNETEGDNEEFAEEKLVDSHDSQDLDFLKLVEETNRILNETNDSFDEDGNADEKSTSPSTSMSIEDAKSNDEENDDDSSENKSSTSTEKYNIDEDTVSKAYSDLKDDLNHLRETWMKLSSDVSERNIKKENLPGFDELETKLADMAHEAQEVEDDYEVIDDKDLFKLFSEIPEEESDADEMEEIQDQEADEVEPTLPTPDVVNSDVIAESKLGQRKLIKYVDDALPANEDSDVTHNIVSSSPDSTIKHVAQEHLVEPFEDNINVFNELEKTSAGPIRITLDLNTPVVLTSPNYPSPYPTNAVIDWILEGEGRGIEFNVTDFALNSIAGDYVMVKPGRVDASGSDGFLLSHTLNKPRLFRFLDVNRMFIRFDSRIGLNRFRGFSFSIKMINPLPEDRVLEPEALPIGYPEHTITLNLGGVTLEEFLHIEEEFRQIVADMATMYIEANQINPGRNKTLEVTQITSRALCFHNWPQFERCAEVRFGVPLQYEDEDEEPRLNEEDLKDMWFSFSNQDPFALRLQRLGINDFQIPNDNNVLMIWLVIAAGVVISMAMLAFALWRFSCFEDYTRMPSYSDTESVNEKKGLDLYPTPHQTLPPLCSGTEYKWGDSKYDDTTRVDMSGYPNRSYVRTEEYDFDSEEDVAVPARDRYTTDV